MRFSHFFIARPIFASVVSLVILIVGTIAYLTLPVAQFPEIVPPTISVRTSYPGANAQTVADTVASVIEQEVNGVEGMIYMYSQSTDDGNMSLSVTFDIGTDEIEELPGDLLCLRSAVHVDDVAVRAATDCVRDEGKALAVVAWLGGEPDLTKLHA